MATWDLRGRRMNPPRACSRTISYKESDESDIGENLNVTSFDDDDTDEGNHEDENHCYCIDIVVVKGKENDRPDDEYNPDDRTQDSCDTDGMTEDDSGSDSSEYSPKYALEDEDDWEVVKLAARLETVRRGPRKSEADSSDSK
jgi:hypothetical protein